MRGLLDGIIAIPAIMAEQGCSREEAERLWIISMELEAERTKPECIFLRDPIEIIDKIAAQFGCSVESAIERMEACDAAAVCQFFVGNSISKMMRN